MDNLLHSLTNLYHESYILLDSNINLLPLNLTNRAESYLETIHNNGYIQCIHKATRSQNSSHSLIDHIITNSHSSLIKSGTIVSDISDHFMTFIQLPNAYPNHHQKVNTTRSLNSENLNHLKENLGNLTWTNVLASQDVNISFDIFWTQFIELYNLCIPLKKTKFNRNLHKICNYMTQGLLVSRLNKISLLKKSIINPTPQNKLMYKKYRNLYNSLIRNSKKLYYENSLNMAKKDPKKTWKILKEALNLTTSNNKVEKLTTNGITTTNPVEIANQFNNFFADVGTSISNSTHPTKVLPESFIQHTDKPDLVLNQTSPESIINILKLLKPKTSADIDGISIKLLKTLAQEISVPLSHIFNLSLNQGVFPMALKSSRVTPIFKAGNSEVCDNYRPISLQSSISKILEKIVSINLTNHLDINNLIYKNQFGFQKGKSTEQNLLLVTDFIANALNDGDYCIGIFLDLKKAFDTCSHKILLKKLKHLGVKGTALQWFSSYLSNRQQRVDIDGNLSDPRGIDISVLQGSILGPILFLCYINDLPNCSTLLTFLFADDAQGLARGKNLPELLSVVNTQLKKWATWFRANKMKVNTSKTKYIIFHTKGKKIETNNIEVIFNDNDEDTNDPNLITILDRVHNNHPDPESRSYKLLGIHLDENLTFQHQITNLTKKLTKAIFCINRAKNFIPQKALTSLYYALFHSHLTYCPTIISIASTANITKIFKLQKKIIRIITNSSYAAHTTPLFHKLNILPYPSLIDHSKLIIMHSIHYQTAPSALINLWPKNNERNPTYELRNNNDYLIPRINYSFFSRSPAYSFPSLWNTATSLTPHRNPITFKIASKYHFQNPPPLP